MNTRIGKYKFNVDYELFINIITCFKIKHTNIYYNYFIYKQRIKTDSEECLHFFIGCFVSFVFGIFHLQFIYC